MESYRLDEKQKGIKTENLQESIEETNQLRLKSIIMRISYLYEFNTTFFFFIFFHLLYINIKLLYFNIKK